MQVFRDYQLTTKIPDFRPEHKLSEIQTSYTMMIIKIMLNANVFMQLAITTTHMYLPHTDISEMIKLPQNYD